MADQTLNVGVAGCRFGARHIRAVLQALPDLYNLRWICDTDEDRLHSLASDLKLGDGCRLSADYHDILEDPDVDVVSLSLPHHLHHVTAVEAAEAGKHIMLDKPIARTLEEADLIIRAAEKNGVQLMIAFNYRFDPLYRKMFDLLQEGAIGRPILANTRHYQAFNPPAGSNWRNRESVGGGCVIGSGIHNIDMMRYLLGEPEQVFAYGVTDRQRLEAEAAAVIAFRYPENLAVNFLCNWVDSGSGPSRLRCGEWELYGDRGDLTSYDGQLRIGRDFGRTEEFIGDLEGNAFASMWRHFRECLESGEPPLTSGKEGRASLALVLKVHEAMEKNTPIDC